MQILKYQLGDVCWWHRQNTRSSWMRSTWGLRSSWPEMVSLDGLFNWIERRQDRWSSNPPASLSQVLGLFYFYVNKFIKNSILEILESWALCRNEWFWWIQNWSLLGGDWTIKDEAWLVACLLGLPSPPYLPRLPRLLSSPSSQPWWTETLATTNSNKRPLLLTCLWGILFLLHKNLTQASAGLTEAFYTERKQTPLSREIFNAVKSHLFQKNSQVDLSVAETEELCNNCASFLLTNIMIKNILGKGGLYFSLHVQVTVYGRGRSGQELNQKP